MTAGLIALLTVAAISWMYRVSFTTVVDADRLPGLLLSRMDAVAPAAFAALVAADLAARPAPALPPALIAMVAAGLATWRTGNHLVAVLAAATAWSLISLLL